MQFTTSLTASLLLVGSAVATTHMAGMSMTTAIAAVSATNGPAASAMATGAAMGQVATHVVQVGGMNGSTIFSPNNIQAEVGDLVQFQFNAKNHSVVQSTFDQPCVPIQNVMANKTDAFFSGFMPNNHTVGDLKNVLTYTIRVTSKTPIWYYCSQAKHCQAGMVGAINAAQTGNKTIAAFAQIAAAAPANLSPGGSAGVAAGASSAAGGAAGSTATATGAAGAASGTGAGSAASGTSANAPAQVSTAAAPPRLVEAAKQGMLGLGWAGIAAFLVL